LFGVYLNVDPGFFRRSSSHSEEKYSLKNELFVSGSFINIADTAAPRGFQLFHGRKGSLHLLVFVEHFPPYLGSDRSVFELCTEAAQSGNKIHFVATQPLRYLLGNRPDDWSYKKNWTTPPPEVHPNISHRYLLVGKMLEKLWSLVWPLAYLLTIILFTQRSIRELRSFSPDVIVASHASPIVGLVSVLTSKLCRKPILMMCPDWMAAYAAELRHQTLHDPGPFLMNTLEIALIRQCNRSVMVTEFLQRVLSTYGVSLKKSEVIPNGVNTTIFSPNKDVKQTRKKYDLVDNTVVLFAGHLDAWTGIEVLSLLSEELVKEVPDARIVLIGAGDAVQQLQDTLRERNLQHVLHYVGQKPFSEMPEHIALADVAICIFPSTLVSHAASPLKLFEYMSTEVAIVATRVAGTAEVLTSKTALLVNPRNKEDICSAVVRLCKDPGLRKELAKEARHLCVERYSWQSLSVSFIRACHTAMNA
jgi:glycosyltransferase involved in cell wall biosynthesis